MTQSTNIPARNYTCYSPLCDGGIKGLDREPKPQGRGAVCWACSSDAYTVPRYGADDSAVRGHPKVTPMMLKTGIGPLTTPGAYNWMNAFSGMTMTPPRQQEAS